MHSDTFGRGLKVSKEEIVAMLVAVERYLARDHEADWREWEARLNSIREALRPLRGVTTDPFVSAIVNQVPHVRIRWDRNAVPIDPVAVTRQLREGDPSVELVPMPYEENSLEMASWTLQRGKAELVAQRIREILSQVV